MSSPETKVFSLKQVLQSIRKTIDKRYQSLYWIKVEMHKLNLSASGHCYPELLQKENGQLIAQTRAIIWKQQFERINKRFVEVVKEPLKDDLTLLMQVRISFSEIYGLTLEIVDIDPSYALGELQRERLETLKKLKDERIIDANQLLDFPLLPKRLAIVSAEGSKGLNDFNQVLDNNKYGYLIERCLFPASVDGDRAVDSIRNQLQQISTQAHNFDAVVIVRGGGGEVGLSCYNNYELCAQVAKFPIPILTGIGHSTNLTVAEMIAYRNAITPTELGEFIIQTFREFDLSLIDLSEDLESSVLSLLEKRNTELGRISERLHARTKENLTARRHALQNLSVNLRYNIQDFFTEHKRTNEQQKQKIADRSLRFTQFEASRLKQFEMKLAAGSEKFVLNQQRNIKDFEQVVRLLDPINVLNRGYSITTVSGQLPSEENLKEGVILETRTKDFTLQSQLTKKEKK